MLRRDGSLIRKSRQSYSLVRRSPGPGTQQLHAASPRRTSVFLREASKSAEPLDIGGFQYPSAARSQSALLQALDSSDVFGSPTWARTRDLRINSRPLDLPANRHECCVFRVVVSNIPCLLRPSRTRGRPSLKHWILEASGGSLHTRGRASRCDREGVGGLRKDGLEAPHGALLSTRRKPIERREGRVGRPRGAENDRDGPGATARCLLAGSTTRPADLGKRPRAAFRYLRLLTRKPP